MTPSQAALTPGQVPKPGQAWAALPVAARLAPIRALRHRIAAEAPALAATAARPGMSAADIMVAEVLPLLAACRFLERCAARILAERRPDRLGRPLWLVGTSLSVRRIPFGRVLVIGPANYPLLLPGIQALQALVAGNVVQMKPAPGCAAPLLLLARWLTEAGLPPGCCTVLDDSAAAASAAIAAGVDRVVLTGGAETGRRVLADLAPRLVPATMELSGRDAMLVLTGADIEVAAQAALFGLRFNAGRTCIAPRRIIVARAAEHAFVARLAALLDACPALPVDPALLPAARAILTAASGRVLGRHPASAAEMPPLVVEADATEAWVAADLFLPLAALLVVEDAAGAVAAANAGPYALGAVVFGPAPAATACARQLRAGCVVVNDMVVPTADPRLPFGGGGDSGFGVTRGAEGLLEMTRVQARIVRAQPSTRHLRPLAANAEALVAALLRLAYGHAGGRLAAARAAWRAGRLAYAGGKPVQAGAGEPPPAIGIKGPA